METCADRRGPKIRQKMVLELCRMFLHELFDLLRDDLDRGKADAFVQQRPQLKTFLGDGDVDEQEFMDTMELLIR
jgi:hypothetical protein